MDWDKLIPDQDGSWLLREEASPYGLEISFRTSGAWPESAKLELAEAVLHNAQALSKTAAEYLASVFSDPRFRMTVDDLCLVWLEIPEEKTLATGDFGLVFSAELDPYLRLTVWYEAAQKDLSQVEPRHFSVHWV